MEQIDAVMTSIGFTRSTFGVCVHRNDDGSLGFILCVHVDDAICGSGLSFSTALTTLRRRFPFRKWQIGEGMFCCSKYMCRTKRQKKS